MAYRPKIVKYLAIPNPEASPANTGSMATSINGAPSVIEGLSMMSYQFIWNGTAPVGTASVQVSNDFSLDAKGNISNPGTWNAMPFNYLGNTVFSVPITGDSGSGVFDIDALGAYAIMPVYTATSGIGTLSVIFNAKVSYMGNFYATYPIGGGGGGGMSGTATQAFAGAGGTITGAIDGSNTVFTLPTAPTSPGSVEVFLDGKFLRQGIGNDYTVSGSTITFASAPMPGQTIDVFYDA